MTHEETSLRTKKALCQALKDLMQQKAFSKITVSELIKACNINRKTFYYHFEDIYALLRWMLEQEAFQVLAQFDFSSDFQEAFYFIIDYVEQNSYVLNCMYDSVGRDELKRFFYYDVIGPIGQIIRNAEEETGIHVSDAFRDFLCDFYAEGIAGMFISLFQHPDKYSTDDLITYFSTIIQNSIPAILTANAI